MTDDYKERMQKAMRKALDDAIPVVPSPSLQWLIRGLKSGTSNPDLHHEDWQRGKRLQMEGHAIPYQHEWEHATGLYNRVIRPQLIELLAEELGIKNLLADAEDQG